MGALKWLHLPDPGSAAASTPFASPLYNIQHLEFVLGSGFLVVVLLPSTLLHLFSTIRQQNEPRLSSAAALWYIRIDDRAAAP